MGRLTENDRCLIWNLRTQKHWGSLRMMKEFPNKTWNRRTIDDLIKKIDTEGTTARKTGSGRPKSARTDAKHQAGKRAHLYPGRQTTKP